MSQGDSYGVKLLISVTLHTPQNRVSDITMHVTLNTINVIALDRVKNDRDCVLCDTTMYILPSFHRFILFWRNNFKID